MTFWHKIMALTPENDSILGGFCEIEAEQFRFEILARSQLPDAEVIRVFRAWLATQPNCKVPPGTHLVRVSYVGDLIR